MSSVVLSYLCQSDDASVLLYCTYSICPTFTMFNSRFLLGRSSSIMSAYFTVSCPGPLKCRHVQDDKDHVIIQKDTSTNVTGNKVKKMAVD